MRVLEDERFRVEINEFGAGADLALRAKGRHGVHLEGRSGGMEAPCAILFPIVGRLKDKTYTVDGRPYEITQHGLDAIWRGRYRKSAAPVRNSRSRRASTRKRCIRGILSAPCAILWTEMR